MATIRELRKRLGLPVDALAHKAGVSTRHIVLWERYGLPPRSRATLEKIARALGVEPDELLPNAENTKVVSDALRADTPLNGSRWTQFYPTCAQSA